MNLKLAAPIDTWDEAIPLGNGLLGGLLWGKDGTIRLSLDRGDLWDLRVQDEFKKADCTWKTIQRLVAEKNQAELVRRFDAPYNRTLADEAARRPARTDARSVAASHFVHARSGPCRGAGRIRQRAAIGDVFQRRGAGGLDAHSGPARRRSGSSIAPARP